MNGLFFIKEEEIIIEGDEVIHKYKVAGDMGWAKEIMYIKVQSIIDGWGLTE